MGINTLTTPERSQKWHFSSMFKDRRSQLPSAICRQPTRGLRRAKVADKVSRTPRQIALWFRPNALALRYKSTFYTITSMLSLVLMSLC